MVDHIHNIQVSSPVPILWLQQLWKQGFPTPFPPWQTRQWAEEPASLHSCSSPSSQAMRAVSHVYRSCTAHPLIIPRCTRPVLRSFSYPTRHRRLLPALSHQRLGIRRWYATISQTRRSVAHYLRRLQQVVESLKLAQCCWHDMHSTTSHLFHYPAGPEDKSASPHGVFRSCCLHITSSYHCKQSSCVRS